MRSLVVFGGLIVLVAPVFAGCLTPSTPKFDAVELVDGALVLELPVHIVTVGFDAFDEAALMKNLKQPVQPYKLLRAEITAQITPEPLQYKLNYMVHSAPAAWAHELFMYAKSVSTQVDPDSFLQTYDKFGTSSVPAAQDQASKTGQQRVCQKSSTPEATVSAPLLPSVSTPKAPCKKIDRIDAQKLETWIEDHRAEAGLAWEGAGYTIFILDSYTQGHLPKDGYHQYAIDDKSADPNVKNQRAWGGDHGFVFFDVGAAPNAYDFRPWRNYTRDGVKMAALEDRPIWDYKSDMDTFYKNLGQNVYDAARMFWARPPIYPFEFAEKYVLPFYIFVDPNAHVNPKSPFYKIKPADLEAHTYKELIQKGFQDLVPWAEVQVDIKFVYLPEGDQGVMGAINDAKHRFSESYIDYGILKKYFRENWHKYVPDVPGARVYPSFGFVLEYPSTSLFAYSDYDETGGSFGVFLNIADAFLCLRPLQPVCNTEEIFQSPDTWWYWWNGVLMHEIGHSFGLTHTHDTGGLDDNGFTTYEVNWMWDSTASIMTYRHSLLQFDQFDKDLVLRGNAVELAMKVLKAPNKATIPQAANDAAEHALDHVRMGTYTAALDDAREAVRLAGMDPLTKLDLGQAGQPVKKTLKLPGSYYPAGYWPVPPPIGLCLPVACGIVGVVPFMPFVPVGVEGVNYLTEKVEVPAGAKALAIEYKEQAAPTHLRQSAYAVIVDKDDQLVTYLGNNAYDKVVLLNLKRCAGGCTLILIGLSGENLAYDLTITPYT